MTEKLMTEAEVAELLQVSSDTLRAWRHRNTGPRYIRLGDGPKVSVRYRATDIDEWLEVHTTND